MCYSREFKIEFCAFKFVEVEFCFEVKSKAKYSQ